MTFEAARSDAGLPDMTVSARQVFAIDSDIEVPAYSRADEHVPDVDSDYQFNKDVTLAILAGFKHNRRVMIQGYARRGCTQAPERRCRRASPDLVHGREPIRARP